MLFCESVSSYLYVCVCIHIHTCVVTEIVENLGFKFYANFSNTHSISKATLGISLKLMSPN